MSSCLLSLRVWVFPHVLSSGCLPQHAGSVSGSWLLSRTSCLWAATLVPAAARRLLIPGLLAHEREPHPWESMQGRAACTYKGQSSSATPQEWLFSHKEGVWGPSKASALGKQKNSHFPPYDWEWSSDPALKRIQQIVQDNVELKYYYPSSLSATKTLETI